MMKSAIVFVFLLGLVAVCASDRHVLNTRLVYPREWTPISDAPTGHPIRFAVALNQRNLDVLETKFNEVSDPESPLWGKFLTIDEINAIVTPPENERQAVMQWLKENGVEESSITDNADAFIVSTTVQVASVLFQTSFKMFQHKKTNMYSITQIGEYSIPMHLKHYIVMIEGVGNFPVPHLNVQRKLMDSTGVVPQTADAMYNLQGATSEKGSQGVIEFQGQSFSPSQLKQFSNGVDIPISDIPKDQIVGPNSSSAPQTEATLDIQWIAGVNNGGSNWFWLESGNNWLYLFATHFFNTQDVPLVNSISYGWNEEDQCQIAGTECSTLGVSNIGYVQRVNTEFQKIGTRGVSLLSASGDSGANGRTDEECTDNHLHPPYPAASPFLTSVGATQINNPKPLSNPPSACSSSGLTCASGGEEVAVSYSVAGFASGGGFSNVASTPDYQKDAVNAYLNGGTALPPAGYYNTTGRGFPDVAALGHNMIIYQGFYQPVGGTSASSPTFAAVMALLNDYKIKATGSPLGFLNPFLYKAAAADPHTFNDITVGDNKCTEAGCHSNCKGFECAKGWDPVTGLGSPNYGNMLAYLKKQIAKHQVYSAEM